MRDYLKKSTFLLTLVLGVFLGIQYLSASEVQADFSVSPVVIDEKGEPRDVIRQSITLTNNSSRRLFLYAFVNNVSIDERGELDDFTVRSDSETDISRSLANWISITRGVINLGPGEVQEVELSVEINLRAEPGKYHAVVFFAEGNTRAQAQERTTRDRSTLVGVEVEEDIDEFLEIKYFSSDKSFFGGAPIAFTYVLENKGNTPLTPRGSIRIYDGNGREAGEVSLAGVTIDPGEEEVFRGALDDRLSMGRYRARLDVEYGGSQRVVLNDTTFFYALSFWVLGAIFFTLLLVVIWLAHIVHKRHEARHKNLLPSTYLDNHPVSVPQKNKPENDLQSDEHTIDLRK